MSYCPTYRVVILPRGGIMIAPVWRKQRRRSNVLHRRTRKQDARCWRTGFWLEKNGASR